MLRALLCTTGCPGRLPGAGERPGVDPQAGHDPEGRARLALQAQVQEDEV